MNTTVNFWSRYIFIMGKVKFMLVYPNENENSTTQFCAEPTLHLSSNSVMLMEICKVG